MSDITIFLTQHSVIKKIPEIRKMLMLKNNSQTNHTFN